MRPATRRRRASFLPRVSRLTASSVASIDLFPYSSDERVSSDEQRRNRGLFMDAPDGLAEQARHREALDLLALLPLAVERNGIGDHELLERRRFDALDRRSRQHAMH